MAYEHISDQLKDITLIWPPLTYEAGNPSFLGYFIPAIAQLGSILKNAGYTISYVDLTYVLNFYKSETQAINPSENHQSNLLKKSVNIVEKTDPDAVAIGSWSANFPFVVEFVRTFKSRNPHCTILLGGYPATFTPDDIFSLVPQVDILIRGEAEYTLPEAINELNKSKKLTRVLGISYRSEDKIVHNRPRPPIKNLDSLPLPDYSGFSEQVSNLLPFPGKTRISINATFSRGCNFSCTYCSTSHMNGYLRRKSPKYVRNEISAMVDAFGLNYLRVDDDNFSSDIQWSYKFCDIINKLDIRWGCLSRTDTMNETLLNKMKNSGCTVVYYGVESLTPSTLTYMNKTNNPVEYIRHSKKIIDRTLEDFMATVGMVVGFPVETKDDMLESIAFLGETADKGALSRISRLWALPGSNLWQKFIKGEIGQFMIQNRDQTRKLGLFSEKYEHLPWCFPFSWAPQNNHMSNNDFDQFLYENKIFV